MRSHFRVWIFCALVLSACQFRPLAFLASPTPTAAPSATPEPVQAPEPTPFPTLAPQVCQQLPEMLESEWSSVSDSQIGFQFQAPARWRPDTSLGSDLILLSSQPADPGAEGPACGRMNMEFRADGIGSWVGWNPEPEAQPIEVGQQNLSAFRVDSDGSGQAGEAARLSEVYVVGGGYFYFMTFEYIPQPGISEVDFQRDLRAFNEIVERILESFAARL